MFCCVLLLFLWGELHLVKLNHEESLLIDSGFTVLTNSAFPDVWRMVLLSPAGFSSPGVSDFARCGWSFLTLAVAVLGLGYLLGWRKEGKRAMIWVELKLKRTLKDISKAYQICQCQCCWRWNSSFWKVSHVEPQKCCWHLLIDWINGWMEVKRTCAHIILESGSEWEHWSLQTSFPDARLDITVFFPSFSILGIKSLPPS